MGHSHVMIFGARWQDAVGNRRDCVVLALALPDSSRTLCLSGLRLLYLRPEPLLPYLVGAGPTSLDLPPRWAGPHSGHDLRNDANNNGI